MALQVSKWSESASSAAFSVGWKTIRTLPEQRANALFARLADRLWRTDSGGVVQLRKNLARVHPELTSEEIHDYSRIGMRSYMRYYCEAFRLPTWSHARISDTFTLERGHLLDDAMNAGTGALMIPGHMANWDHAGAWAALRFGRVTTVAERLKPESLFRQFLEYRTRLGMEVLPLGQPDVMQSLVRRLRAGGLVALLGDRDLGASGVRVTLLGEEASLPAGPAVLALMTDAPLHPVSMWFEDGGTRGYVHDRIPIPTGTREEQIQSITQSLADALGEGIRQHSADWHMLQRVWTADVKVRAS